MKGWSELLLLSTLVVAAWVRTPVGALAHAGWAVWNGQTTPDVLVAFRTGLPDHLAHAVAAIAAHGPPTSRATTSGPWTAGLDVAVEAQLGGDAITELKALDPTHPDRALARRALGEDTYTRAVRRARLSGAANPHQFAAYAPFLPDKAARRAEREVRDVLSLSTALSLVWPVDPSVRMTSPFGTRVHPVLGTKRHHEGVDLAVPIGTPVHASGSGTVARARATPVSGNAVVLDHGHGVTTNYCHGSAFHVGRGDHVQQGGLIMDSGNTGRSTGPHLHFGVRIHGRSIDPAPFRVLPAPKPVTVDTLPPTVGSPPT